MKQPKHKFLTTMGVIAMVSNVVEASPVEQYEPGIRAMAMGGAFVAQADDSSAMWYNPAGLMRLVVENGSSGDFTIVSGNSQYAESDSKNPDGEQLGLLFGNGLKNMAVAVGGYDTASTTLQLHNSNTNTTVQQTLDSYDISLALAYGVGDLLMGGSMGITTLSPQQKSSSTVEDVVFSAAVGAQYRLLNRYFDVFNRSLLFETDIGAIYRPETKATPFKGVYNHLYRNIEFTATPETASAGLHVGMGWISESNSWKLNTNVDSEQLTYTDMATYLFGSPQNDDVVVVRNKVGTELQMTSDGSNWVFSFRGGVAQEQSDFSFMNQQTLSGGIGATYKQIAIDLALLKTESTENDVSFSRDTMAVSVGVVW